MVRGLAWTGGKNGTLKLGSETVFFGGATIGVRIAVDTVGWLLDIVVSNVQFVSFKRFRVASGSSNLLE